MNSLEDSYEARCFRYFRSRYLIRVKAHQLTPYHVPNSPCDLLPYLLNDREFYHGRLHAAMAFQEKYSSLTSIFDMRALLWEMLGTRPDDFMMLCTTLSSGNSSRFWETFTRRTSVKFVNLRVSRSVDDFESFLRAWPMVELDYCSKSLLNTVIPMYREDLSQLDAGLFITPCPLLWPIYPLTF